MIRINDFWLRWLGPLGLFLFGNLFFRLSFWMDADLQTLFDSILVGLVAGYLFWEVNRLVISELQEQFPGLERSQKRLLLILLLSPLLVNAAVFFRYVLHILLGSRHVLWIDLVDYVTSLGIQLFYFAVYFSIYEGWYVMQQWRQTYQEKEALVKAQWQTRFDSLKSQVNPHFLFNSLNSLSALIDESPMQASQFVDELSTMYRYLLRANDRELILLSTELTFIESYAHLLKTRHGAGLTIQIHVAPDYLGHSIPPLTLQLLVENAVKHNIVMAEQPLKIEIATTSDGQLLVRNNLQRKNVHNASNGIGLANVAAKYQMLAQSTIVIEDEDEHFTVLLPLLN
ncbi:hypothetical protein GCM10028807_14130 [Spirosoma daeguense]